MLSTIGPTANSSADAPRAARLRRAAQDGADAGDQLARIERLAEIVVGAELQSDDAIDVVAARRQHQDGRVVRGAELAQHVEAADARQHHVQNQDLEVVQLELVERVAAVVHALHLEVLGLQIFGEHLAELAVVVHQQHARLARRCGVREGLFGTLVIS